MKKQGGSKKPELELHSEKTSESICASKEGGRVKSYPTQKQKLPHKHFCTENLCNGGT
jgi:hypothetical protein